MRCRAICESSGRQCTGSSSVDGLCIRHWWKQFDETEEEVEIPL